VSEVVNRKTIIRPAKMNVFLFVAWTIKELSCDAQTKHGCVITSRRNRILGTGYNSFPRECDNESLPNLRPTTPKQEKDPLGNKYPLIIHSEINAVNNCIHSPIEHEDGCIAYVTGQCCFNCFLHLWQNGVNEVYEIDRGSHMLKDGHDEKLKELLCSKVSMTRHVIKPDFGFMNVPLGDAHASGFFHTELEDFKDLINVG
jgi:deoxycytidylate deaminase